MFYIFQLVVDDRMLIRDAYVGWPGCTHDARVFRNSPLWKHGGWAVDGWEQVYNRQVCCLALPS